VLRKPEQSAPSGFPTNETMEMERVLRAQLELQSRYTRCAPVWRIRAPRWVHTEPGGRRLLLGLGASVISLGCVGFVFKEDILLYISKQAAPFARKLSTALLANQAALASRRIPPQHTHARTFLLEAVLHATAESVGGMGIAIGLSGLIDLWLGADCKRRNHIAPRLFLAVSGRIALVLTHFAAPRDATHRRRVVGVRRVRARA
jgi:hypothetical protein